jgi:uncharacterized protein (UPF0276 family)
LPARTGIGLKPQHFQEILDERPDIGFFEVHAENHMVPGGPMLHFLTRIRAQYPLSLHGVGLSMGGEEPLDAAHLQRLRDLIDRFEPAVFSEHLAWSSHGGHFFNDLLPLPYNAETLARVCQHVDEAQSCLRRQILLENPATCLAFASSTLNEPGFLCEVVRRTGCGLLLDINNVHVSCVNHGLAAAAYVDALPLHAVGEVHLAGFAQDVDAAGAPLLIDSHGSPVDEAVWSLYARLIAVTGPLPTLLERDHDVPSLATLLAEAARADRMLTRECPA